MFNALRAKLEACKHEASDWFRSTWRTGEGDYLTLDLQVCWDCGATRRHFQGHPEEEWVEPHLWRKKERAPTS